MWQPVFARQAVDYPREDRSLNKKRQIEKEKEEEANKGWDEVNTSVNDVAVSGNVGKRLGAVLLDPRDGFRVGGEGDFALVGPRGGRRVVIYLHESARVRHRSRVGGRVAVALPPPFSYTALRAIGPKSREWGLYW